MVEIITTEKYGLANTIDGIIYLHPILDEFPSTKTRVIRHEIEHTKKKSWLGQRKVDAFSSISFRELLPIYKRKPSLLLKQYSPITYIEKTLLIEWSLVFLYLFYIGVGALIFWIIKLFSTDSVFFWKVIQYMFWIFAIVIVLYLGGKWLKNYINEEAKKRVTKK